jgi:FlaA1/EpsC-like NDP-sugar epimerase
MNSRIENLMRSRIYVIVFEALLVIAAYYSSFLLRLDFSPDERSRTIFLISLPWVLLIKLAIFYACGLLKGWWRYAGMSGLADITKASLTSGLLLYTAQWLGFWSVPGYLKSIVLIDLVLTIFFTGGARLLVRTYTESLRSSVAAKETLIVGAGVAGATIMREFKLNPGLDYKPIGFVDDDLTKLGIKVHGKKVLGTTNDIPALAEKYNVKCVLIAIPSATGKEIDKIVHKCSQSKVEYKWRASPEPDTASPPGRPSGPAARSAGSREYPEKTGRRVGAHYRSRRLDWLGIGPSGCPVPASKSCAVGPIGK